MITLKITFLITESHSSYLNVVSSKKTPA